MSMCMQQFIDIDNKIYRSQSNNWYLNFLCCRSGIEWSAFFIYFFTNTSMCLIPNFKACRQNAILLISHYLIIAIFNAKLVAMHKNTLNIYINLEEMNLNFAFSTSWKDLYNQTMQICYILPILYSYFRSLLMIFPILKFNHPWPN